MTDPDVDWRELCERNDYYPLANMVERDWLADSLDIAARVFVVLICALAAIEVAAHIFR
jgi:hypothetical protein